MSLLLLFGGAGVAVPPVVHHAQIREGDSLLVLLPNAGFTPVCTLVRVIARRYSDRDGGLLEIEVQEISQFVAGENLRYVADTGPIPSPKAIIPATVDVPTLIAVNKTDVQKLTATVELDQATK